MQYKKFRLPGLSLKKQLIQSFLMALILTGFGSFRIAVAQVTDCSACSLHTHNHPAFWMLAGALLLSIPIIILWRHNVLKQFQRLQNAQATLQVYNAELSREIRQRQQAEAALQRLNQELEARTRQLETTNHELESFSYSVSHDLRAPSRHIHGFVSVLRQHLEQGGLLSPEAVMSGAAISKTAMSDMSSDMSEVAGDSPAIDPKVSHYLDVIESSSRKMGLLIDGLLTLSRVGRRQMQRHPVALNTLVAEAIASAQIDNPEGKAIEFRIGDLPTLNGDAVLLQQVLFNLINNAIKFSRNVDAPWIEIGSLPDQTVFVRDNGIGFAMEDAEHIFDAFQRLHGREFAGTGIGLAIVQRIVRRHNGQVWTESQPNQGATFYFQLGK